MNVFIRFISISTSPDDFISAILIRFINIVLIPMPVNVVSPDIKIEAHGFVCGV